MDRLNTKGLRVYTAALFLTGVMIFVLNAPQQSALAGMAVLAAIVGVMATAIGRDLTTAGRADDAGERKPARTAI